VKLLIPGTTASMAVKRQAPTRQFFITSAIRSDRVVKHLGTRT
jgi:hypothetical protein